MLENEALKEKYDKIKWSYNKKHIENWSNGTTGFILIDAAMRELNETGFQHNRARMKYK
jgi:deoxyribodipyrimidine photo-lyase